MPVNNSNIPAYSATDLLRYATGRMTAPEMHAIEKAALEDPFLAEAIEGYIEAAKAHPQLQTNIDKLIPVTKEKDDRKIVPLWQKKVFQYAAAAAIILGGGWFTYSLLNPIENEKQTIAIAPAQAPAKTAAADTGSLNLAATNSAPAAQSPVVAERNQYANVETNKVADDAVKQQAQQPVIKNNETRIIKDSVVMQRADNTNVVMDEVAKNERKDVATLPATVAKPAPAPTETSSIDKLTDRQRSEAFAKAKRSTDAETRNVFRGRITDAKNNPLPYANVMITGENIGTYTDSKGNFNFTYDDSILPVRTRSLGYESQTVQMKPGSREQQIIMPEDEKLKESLVVVTQKPQAKQAGLKPLIIETDSLSSVQPVVGLIDYNTYLLNNNRISELPGASRSVELSFEVDKRGEVKNITVEQSSGKELDAEAIRLLKEGPKWKSGNGGTGRARVKVKL